MTARPWQPLTLCLGKCIRFALLIAGPILLTGCYSGYLARAAYEEVRVLWHREPIASVIAQKNISEDTRAKLEMVLKVREFAANQLGLNVGGAYETIAPIDSGAIVHVVMAAPQDSLTPYTWWFPIVGSVPYRGYFDPADARAEAADLERDGLDTMIRPAAAFSSLGFFDDPLLTNLLKLDRVELAGVIIHELFHRTYFIPSDAMFDESAATYVGAAGAAAFFADTEGKSSPDAIAAQGVVDSDLKLSLFLLQQESRLLHIYMSGDPSDEILKRRTAAFVAIQADYAALAPQLSGLERFDLDKQPINNAVMIDYLLYFHDLNNFA
ncbi:MAG TPA: aminopeptidase, partial [Candidatus Binataceae bacterium]|nr:aminopeptidase [Candidatus Binataceae bacterium]